MKHARRLFAPIQNAAFGDCIRRTTAALCTAGLCAALAGCFPATSFADGLSGDYGAQVIASYMFPGPEVEAYDETYRILYGSSEPGQTIMMFDQSGQVISQAQVSDDGSFEVGVPEGVDLGLVAIALVSAEGSLVSETLYGDSLLYQLAYAELQSITVASSQSTQQIVEGIKESVNRGGISEYVEGGAADVMPILPYALGVGSALLGMGLVSLIRLTVANKEGKPKESSTARHSSAGHIAREENGIRDSASRSTESSGMEMELDDLEQFALAYIGASISEADKKPAQSISDDTLPIFSLPNKQNQEVSVDPSQIVAGGKGKVHRVSTPRSHLDFSGINIVSDAIVQSHNEPAADPLLMYEDWRGETLGELAGYPQVQESPRMDTEEYLKLLNTQETPKTIVKKAQAAPVVGPRVDSSAAEQRRKQLKESKTESAALVRARNEEFLSSRRSQEEPRRINSLEDALSTYSAFSGYATQLQNPSGSNRNPSHISPSSVMQAEQRHVIRDADSIPDRSYADYIDAMVQDELAHRHDTATQRNVALGKMKIVNGNACSPIPPRQSENRFGA